VNCVLPVTAAVRGSPAMEATRKGVLIAGIMPGVAYVAMAVARFIPLKVIELLCSARRQRTVVSMVRIEAVVDVAVEAMRAMEPGAGTNEHTAGKPVGAVVAIGRAVIWCIVEISVRAHGWGADTDRNLGWRGRCAA
jgi:hypothetical protein